VGIVVIALGCVDLVRGLIHTALLEYAALHIAGLDLSTATAYDQLQLLGVFGISNLITGALLILIGWQARHLALPVLALIPAAYVLGALGLRANAAGYAPSQAQWGGKGPMLVYMAVCGVTFVVGVIVQRRWADA
jgi:hypothetical protein